MAHSSPGDDAAEPSEEPARPIRQAFITGIAITIPAIVTLVVLQFIIGFVAGALDPVAVVVNFLIPGTDLPRTLLQAAAGVVLVLAVFAVGFVANRTSGDQHARRFHALMESVPVVGSIYESFQEMSDLVFDADTDSFREVKLVEFPREDSYAIGFVTADTATVVEEAAGHDDLVTLYVPLGPNPVMGGFVVHVPRDRLDDVDLSVEEGVQSIITSGVALDEEHGIADDGSPGDGAVPSRPDGGGRAPERASTPPPDRQTTDEGGSRESPDDPREDGGGGP